MEKLLGSFFFKGKEIPFVEQITIYSEVQQIISRYQFASKFVEGKDVLEVACGSGYGGYYFMSKGAKTVTCGDLSESAIAYGKLNYVKKGLGFQVLNAAKLPFPDSSFDVIVSIETLEHVAGYEDFIRECGRVLKESGVFVCSTPDLNKTKDSPFLKNLTVVPDEQNFTVDILRTLLRDYFKEISFYGTGHTSSYIDISRFKLQSFLKYFSYAYPKVGKVVKFVTRSKTLRMYRPMQLPIVEDFDGMLERAFIPYPLEENNNISPHTIITVARK